MKIAYFIVLVSCLPWLAQAQRLKVVSATGQEWSGGVAGRSGERFNFVINCTGLTGDFIPDTLWAGGESFALFTGDQVNAGNTTIAYSKNKTCARIVIEVEIVRNEMSRYGASLPGEDEKPVVAPPPFEFKGVALVGYHSNGKKRYFKVNGFTKALPPIDYP